MPGWRRAGHTELLLLGITVVKVSDIPLAFCQYKLLEGALLFIPTESVEEIVSFLLIGTDLVDFLSMRVFGADVTAN